jgi:hypothetical protein
VVTLLEQVTLGDHGLTPGDSVVVFTGLQVGAVRPGVQVERTESMFVEVILAKLPRSGKVGPGMCQSGAWLACGFYLGRSAVASRSDVKLVTPAPHQTLALERAASVSAAQRTPIPGGRGYQ